MKTKGFGARPPRNVSAGGKRPLGDPYNKALKGDPFNRAFKKAESPGAEYAMSGMDAYHHYDAQKDLTGEQENKPQKQQTVKKQNASRLQKVMQQVVGLVAGSVIVVTGYQAAAEQKPAPQTPGVVETGETDPGGTADPAGFSASFAWNEDLTAVIVTLSDSEGRTVKELPAAVAVTREEASCGKEGTVTYTATAEDGESVYSDSRAETLPALSHAFDEGKAVVLEDGGTATVFECTQCHEQFTVKTSMTEND